MNNTNEQSSHIPANIASLSSSVSTTEHGHCKEQVAHFAERNEKETVDVEQLGKDLGVMRIEPKQSVYHGGQHWVSTMFQIQEFRDYLETHSDDLSRVAVENKKASEEASEISFLRGLSPPVIKEDLLLYIPERAITNVLVSRFFGYVSRDIPVVHESTFRLQYAEHWENPSRTDVTWLGLLFSILQHAELSLLGTGDDHRRSNVAEYRQRAIQCLHAPKYTEPDVNTIEVLVLHIYAEWVSSQDSSIEVSLLLGIVIRLAMRLGMHRDSRAHGMPPFQAEMRRRVWSIIRTLDIVSSFQLSLPATLHYGDSRCAMPRNIYDFELRSDMQKLPPSRPLAEATEISYMIVKTRLILELGKIVTFGESEDDPSNEDIAMYERSLEEVRKTIPQRLSVSPSQSLHAMSGELQKQCIDLDRIYQVSQCVLYRRSLSQARQDSVKARHRRLCIESALKLLAHQATLHLELDRFYYQNARKRHVYTLTIHDFCTASMAIALDLHYGFESEPFKTSPSDIDLWGYDRRNEMITALETSTEFYKLSKDESIEAANAYGILAFVVAKARKAQWMIAEQQVMGTPGTASSDSNTVTADLELDTDFFNGSLPDFDWNLWDQFGNSYEDTQALPP